MALSSWEVKRRRRLHRIANAERERQRRRPVNRRVPKVQSVAGVKTAKLGGGRYTTGSYVKTGIRRNKAAF